MRRIEPPKTQTIQRSSGLQRGMSAQFSQQTPISRSKGKLGFVCPVCLLSFERFAAWAKKVDVNYCSRECAGIGRRVRVIIHCITCESPFEVVPSNLGKLTTCSKLCSSLRRRGTTPNPRSAAVALQFIRDFIREGRCIKCRASAGPWAVRGLIVTFPEHDFPQIETSKVTLWCRQCHLEDIALLGGIANALRISE